MTTSRERQINISVGAAIRACRQAADRTVDDLAAAAEISATFLDDVEHGYLSPSVYTLTRVAEALKMTVGALLGERAVTVRVVRDTVTVMCEACGRINQVVDFVVYCDACTPPAVSVVAKEVDADRIRAEHVTYHQDGIVDDRA